MNEINSFYYHCKIYPNKPLNSLIGKSPFSFPSTGNYYVDGDFVAIQLLERHILSDAVSSPTTTIAALHWLCSFANCSSRCSSCLFCSGTCSRRLLFTSVFTDAAIISKSCTAITPEAIENVKAALASSEIEQKAEVKKEAVPPKAAELTWEDPTLAEWPENDFRLFCGNLGNEVNDNVLSKTFSRFPSFNMARVMRDKRTGKTKGYGFVSFSNPSDLVVALKEMNGKYVGNRPVQLRKSKWKDRIDYEALARQKNLSPKKVKSPKKSVLHK